MLHSRIYPCTIKRFLILRPLLPRHHHPQHQIIEFPKERLSVFDASSKSAGSIHTTRYHTDSVDKNFSKHHPVLPPLILN